MARKINGNILIVLVLTSIFFFAQISFSSSSESDCVEKYIYKKGYQEALNDIKKGKWEWTELEGALTYYEAYYDDISKEAEKYGLIFNFLGLLSDFTTAEEFCHNEGYTQAVRDKLKEKYGFDVIKKIDDKFQKKEKLDYYESLISLKKEIEELKDEGEKKDLLILLKKKLHKIKEEEKKRYGLINLEKEIDKFLEENKDNI